MRAPFEQFLDAIDAEDDEAAETRVAQLTVHDEQALIALFTGARNPDQRWWAVRALAVHGSGDAISVLVTALDDRDDGVRAAAALALAHLHVRESQAVNPLLDQIARLLADEQGLVRQAATDSLTLCGDDAVDILAVTLAGDHQGARTRAMMALRKVATFPAAKVMFQYLNDSNYLVHTYAYEGLDEMGLLENVLLLP